MSFSFEKKNVVSTYVFFEGMRDIKKNKKHFALPSTRSHILSSTDIQTSGWVHIFEIKINLNKQLGKLYTFIWLLCYIYGGAGNLYILSSIQFEISFIESVRRNLIRRRQCLQFSFLFILPQKYLMYNKMLKSSWLWYVMLTMFVYFYPH